MTLGEWLFMTRVYTVTVWMGVFYYGYKLYKALRSPKR